MRTRLSRYTLLLSGLGIGLAVAVYAAVRVLLAMDLEAAATAVSDFGEVAVVLLAAIIVLRTALSFAPGEAVRRYWLLIGAGVAMFLAGDTIWAFIEVVQGKDTFPSVADVFYVAQYVFLGAGIILAVLAYRWLLDVRWPFVVASVASVVLAVGLYVFLLQTIIADTETALLAKALSVFYPLADVFLLFLPALAIVLIAEKFGRGSFGWPWWPVALGMVLLALSDAGYAYLDWNGLYAPGQIVDIGWMLAMMSLATGALVARDVFGVKSLADAGDRAA